MSATAADDDFDPEKAAMLAHYDGDDPIVEPGDGAPYDAPKAEPSKAGATVDDSHSEKTDVATGSGSVAASGKTRAKRSTKSPLRVVTENDLGAHDWRSNLICTKKKTLMRVVANAVTILTHDEQWQGVYAWDELLSGVVCRKKPLWHSDDDDGAPLGLWCDTDGTKLQNWLMRVYRLNLATGQCYAAAELVAKKNKFHPIRSWVRGLQWDGKKRVETWLIRYLGAPDTPYVRMVSRFFLVSAVARAMVPGCKVDTMLILEGLQGIKKSTTLRTLFGKEWFSDASIDWDSKDRFEVLRGKWCVEMAELDGIHKAEVSRVKAFISAQVDDYRRPYAKGSESAPRHCVFAGTVNPNALGTYLRDDENRRFWPVKCTMNANLAALAAERDQLWAEAVAIHDDPSVEHRRWWPETEEEKQLCADEAELRRVGDPWQGLVDDWLDASEDELTITDVMVGIRLDKSRMDNGGSVRIANCLKNAEWENVGRKRRNGQRETFYKRPDDDMERAAEARRQKALKAAKFGDPHDW